MKRGFQKPPRRRAVPMKHGLGLEYGKSRGGKNLGSGALSQGVSKLGGGPIQAVG